MDNLYFRIRATGQKTLFHALHVPFSNARRVTHFADVPFRKENEQLEAQPRALVLFWSLPPGKPELQVPVQAKDDADGPRVLHYNHPIHPLPSPLDVDGACDTVWRWLQEVPDSEFDDYFLDSDVQNERGWELSCDEDWGHVYQNRYALLRVVPAWAWYGK